MDSIVALPWTPKGKDAIMVVIDRFSKMIHFIARHKCDDVKYITNLFFQEIVRLHEVSRTIVSDRETNFLPHY